MEQLSDWSINIGAVAYGFAALANLGLVVLLVTSWRGRLQGGLFLASDADESGDMQAHDDEYGATNLSQDPDVIPQGIPNKSDRCPERDKHDRKAKHES